MDQAKKNKTVCLLWNVTLTPSLNLKLFDRFFTRYRTRQPSTEKIMDYFFPILIWHWALWLHLLAKQCWNYESINIWLNPWLRVSSISCVFHHFYVKMLWRNDKIPLNTFLWNMKYIEEINLQEKLLVYRLVVLMYHI